MLLESPCYRCGCQDKCNDKIRKVPKFLDIRDNIFADAKYNFHNCPLWIALNASEIMDES